MHIEPGLLAQGKLMFANAAAVAVLAAHAPALVKKPALWLRRRAWPGRGEALTWSRLAPTPDVLP